MPTPWAACAGEGPKQVAGLHLFARVELRFDGGWYQVVLEQDCKVLSLKGENLRRDEHVELVRVDNLRAASEPRS